MSPDENFAAQMWTWPDPMLKRDASGRVVVVNGAFLRLYGGQVADWAGNPVAGWPTPQTPGQTSQFETRIEQEDGTEIVYDWLETTLQDGSALAFARNVSKYCNIEAPQIIEPVAQTAQALPTPPQEASIAEYVPDTPQQAVSQNAHQSVPGQAVAATSQEPQAYEPAYTAPTTPQAPALPVQTTDNIPQVATEPYAPQDQVVAPPPMPTSPPVQAELAQQTYIDPTEQLQSPQMSQHETEQPQNLTQPAQSIAAPNMPPLQPQQPIEAEASRETVRRTLPIEDGDAVLGNNWRDAVIAKAVGVEDVEEIKPAVTASHDSDMAEESNSSLMGQKILLAEDNAINALLTRTLLEAEGCQVDVVEDGALAVEAVRNTQYDMVFMDMRMPNMDGLEATRKIRAMGLNAKTLPIVALTANAFDDDRNACFDSGMNDFMTKPVAAEELSEMVHRHTTEQAQAA